MTYKLVLQWLPCQAPGIIGSVLGLVSPVSVYCDWVRWKVGSATSISVWQYLKLSEHVAGTLSNQLTNNRSLQITVLVRFSPCVTMLVTVLDEDVY